MAGTAGGHQVIAREQSEGRIGYMVKLSRKEERFLQEVLDELEPYWISEEERETIQQQIIEHIEESREQGEDGVESLGSSTTFVKDFLEINGIDLHAEIQKTHNSPKKNGALVAVGICTLIGTYVLSQLVLSLVATDAFNPLNKNGFDDYHLLFQISTNPWWNTMLLLISLSVSCLSAFMAVRLWKKPLKMKRKSP
jgi:hypothetical protein